MREHLIKSKCLFFFFWQHCRYSICIVAEDKAPVAPEFEYAVPVWQTGSCNATVQRKGLAMCLGIPGTAACRH